MKKILSTLVLVSAVALSSTASAEQASAESIKSLMRQTGSGDIGVQMMDQMLPALKKMVPDAPEKFWTDVMKEVNANEIEDLVIPVYQKHLSAQDIEAITAFYQTPAGKKLLKVQPEIMKETFAIGQEWGQGVAREILSKYKNTQ